MIQLFADCLAYLRSSPWVLVPLLCAMAIIGLFAAEAVHRMWTRQ